MFFHRLKTIFATPWRRTLYIIFFSHFITGVGFSSIFPFLPLYVKDLGTTTNLSIELLAGMVFSGQALTMMIASPIWGVLADRYGRKLMVMRSLFGGSVIMLLSAFVRSAEELVLLRAVQGIITGTVSAVNALIASAVPRERTGYALGLIQVGIGSGLAIGPIIGGAVADIYGYSAAFYVTALLLFIAGITVLVGVEEEFVPVEIPSIGLRGYMTEWRHILSIPGVTIIYGMRFISQLGRTMINPIVPLFIPLLLTDQAHVNTFNGLVSGFRSGAITLSAFYLGRLGDRIGHRRIVIIALGFAAFLYLPQSIVTAGWQLLVLQALVGVALGGIVPIISSLLASYTKPGEEGTTYGLDSSINSGARAIAPILGSTIALWLGLRATFIATSITYLIAGVLAVIRLPKPKTSMRCERQICSTCSTD